MSVYVVIGGVNGIGKATADTLRAENNEVIVIDREPGGDIIADISIPGQRAAAVEQVFARCPDGIDGLAIFTGIVSPVPDNRAVISVNYYGSVFFAEALFPLLKKKHGSCVLTASASLTWSRP
ncbi:MAG: SDR family NAD(P)-dependent oxidoreductase [Oscillospiraceae bacterium]|nr:SDR family NAD(P)-dependent oxidoreductase [Oscillospiraceae bacterium]